MLTDMLKAADKEKTMPVYHFAIHSIPLICIEGKGMIHTCYCGPLCLDVFQINAGAHLQDSQDVIIISHMQPGACQEHLKPSQVFP